MKSLMLLPFLFLVSLTSQATEVVTTKIASPPQTQVKVYNCVEMVINKQASNQVEVLCKEPIPTPIPPPTHPDTFVWNPNGNTRYYATGVGQFEVLNLYFTPTSANQHSIQLYSASDSSQINRLLVLRNPANDQLAVQLGQFPIVRWSSPPYVVGKQYHIEVSPVNPDGSWSCNRMPCDFVVELTNG